VKEVSNVSKVLSPALFLFRANFLPFVDLLYGLFPHSSFAFPSRVTCFVHLLALLSFSLSFTLFSLFVSLFILTKQHTVLCLWTDSRPSHTIPMSTQDKKVAYKAYEYSPTFMRVAGFKPASKFHKFKEIYFVSLIWRSRSASSSTYHYLSNLGVARRVIQKGDTEGWYRRVIQKCDTEGWYRRVIQKGDTEGWYSRVIQKGDTKAELVRGCVALSDSRKKPKWCAFVDNCNRHSNVIRFGEFLNYWIDYCLLFKNSPLIVYLIKRPILNIQWGG